MRKYIPFILIFIMLILILGSSAISGPVSYGSSEVVARFVKELMAFMGDNNYCVTTIDMIIRKLAHFSEYMLLTVLLSIGFLNITKRKWFPLLISGFIGFTVSLLDEGFVQAFTSRNSSLFDVLVDCSGIMAGLLVIFLYLTLGVKMKK